MSTRTWALPIYVRSAGGYYRPLDITAIAKTAGVFR